MIKIARHRSIWTISLIINSIAQTDLLRVVRMIQRQCDGIAASQVSATAVEPLITLLESLRLGPALGTDWENLDLELAKLQSCGKSTTQLHASVIILSSLFFTKMDARHSSISDAHRQTFSWLLEQSMSTPPPDDPRSLVKFKEWLSSGSGIYWIAGKPGSGKSTLMKYLQSHDKTRGYLASWAAGSRLTVTGYYFWLAGSEMGKSQEGLLRRLLFDILQSHPDWIPILMPRRWDKLIIDRFAHPDFRLADDRWTLSELLEAISRLDRVVACPSSSAKICIFIDGLDEYYGDHLELICTIRTIAKVNGIKLCVSSRPWNCFEDAFGTAAANKLYLQDLTRDDIASYARDKLLQLQALYFGKLDSHHIIEELVSEIVLRAQGVFLWVFLVVRSLRDGIVNGDPLSLLQARLRELPTDLEAFFERIIKSVDKVYRRRMAHTFQVAMNAPPLPLLLYSFLDEEHDRIPLPHGLPYDDIRHAVATIEEDRMCRSLNGRYKGLLETAGEPGCKTVSFLHRTIRDFLATRDMQDLLGSHCEPDFNPFRHICTAFISQESFYPGSMGLTEGKTSQDAEGYPERLNMSLLETFLICARNLGPDQISLVEQMNTVIYHMLPPYQDAIIQKEVYAATAGTLFGRAIELALTPYVLHKLSTRTKLSETEGASALSYALMPWRIGRSRGPEVGFANASADIVSALLNAGASGSSRWIGKSILSELAGHLPIVECRRLGPEIRQSWLRICASLCRHGARMRDCLPEDHEGYHHFIELVSLVLTSSASPTELLGDFLPMVFGTGWPCNKTSDLSDLVTEALWAKFLMHMYISVHSPSSLYGPADEGREHITFFAATAKLFLDNGANPFKCLIGAVPHEMQIEIDSVVPLRGPQFRERGYIFVPEALRAIFKDGSPDRLGVLAALERATQQRASKDVSEQSRGQKRGFAEVQELGDEDKSTGGRRRVEDPAEGRVIHVQGTGWVA